MKYYPTQHPRTIAAFFSPLSGTLYGLLFMTLAASQASGVTIVSSDFVGRSASTASNTATDISYTTNGVADPGDLTVVQASGSGLNGFFNTADTASFLAPDLNTGNEGNWQISVPLTLTASSLELDEVVLTGGMFNNSGTAQASQGTLNTRVILSFVGSSSGSVYAVEQTASANTNLSNLWTLTYASIGATLTNAETWDMVVTTNNTIPGTGNNTGWDSFTVSGTVVPEATTTSLAMAIAVLGLVALRQRNKRQ